MNKNLLLVFILHLYEGLKIYVTIRICVFFTLGTRTSPLLTASRISAILKMIEASTNNKGGGG